MAKLIIPVGIPGSGKSTWARSLLGHKYAIVSSDEIRKELWGSLRAAHDVSEEEKKRRNEEVWKKFDSRVEERLRHNVDTYADGTNLTERRRKILTDMAVENKAETHIFIFDNLEQALQRNPQRNSDIVVPDDVQEEFLKLYADSFNAIFDAERERYASVTILGALH